MTLADKKCVPCKGGVPPLAPEEFLPLLKELEGWEVVENFKLKKVFQFKDFVGPMNLAVQVGEIAEAEGHHPDLLVRWGELGVEIWTHKVNGLTESDFILAAKIDKVASS